MAVEGNGVPRRHRNGLGTRGRVAIVVTVVVLGVAAVPAAMMLWPRLSGDSAAGRDGRTADASETLAHKGSEQPAGSAPAAPATPAPAKSPTASPSPRTPAPLRTVRITAVGDINMGKTNGSLPPDGGSTFFRRVTPYLTGDLVLGNLETTLTSNAGYDKCSGSSGGCVAFRVPPSYADWLKRAGFDALTMANNHSGDYGTQGRIDTRAALDRRGIAYTGAPGQIAYLTSNGTRVAFIGFAPYASAQNLLDIPGATRLVRRAAEHADLVVVMGHEGAEGSDKTHVHPGHEYFLGEDRGDSIAFSHAVIDAGADLVLASGPHVMRGMEFYRGRLITYSLGNFSSYGTFAMGGPLGIGGIVRVTLRSDGTWVGGDLVPTHMVGSGIPAPDPDREACSLVDGLSRSDLGDRAVRLSRCHLTVPSRPATSTHD